MSPLKQFKPKFFRVSVKRCLILTVLIGTSLLVILSLYHDLGRTINHVQQLQLQKITEKCRDWHDYEQIYSERVRRGPGENGEAFRLEDAAEKAENEKIYNSTGFAAIVSDKISVNRSVPDVRPPNCMKLVYPAELPSASVIIIFHNEIMSVLLRTIHSVVNRTPPELLHEIILVNDFSSRADLYGPLQEYLTTNFKTTTIKIKNLKERKGLIVTRLEGAAIATGEVLVFFE